MMKKILVGLAILAAVLAPVATVVAVVEPAAAKNAWTSEACKKANADQKEALGCNDGGVSAPNVVLNVIKVIMGIVGILTVVMLIVAGQRYMTAAGDPGKIQQAKNMIAFSIVGLIVAILAFAIVVFVENVVIDAEEQATTSYIVGKLEG